jgi:polysaccharide biosynthesis/export protein
LRLVRKSKLALRGSGRPRLPAGLRLAIAASFLMLPTGCELWNQAGEINSFIDPTESNIRPLHSAPLIKPVLDTLDPKIEEPNDQFANATDVQPEDLLPEQGDYRIGKNDLVAVSIYDLLGEGTGETVKSVRVSESGYVSLDFIKPVYAVGLTEVQLQDAIKQAYADAGQIRNARVSVTVAEERARIFSVWGNVGAVGQYQILQNDFRLLDALILAKGLAQNQGIEFCYVVRQPPMVPPPSVAQTQPSAAPTETPPSTETPLGPPPLAPEDQPSSGSPVAPTTQLLEPPHSQADWSEAPHMMSTSGDEPATAPAPSAAPADAMAATEPTTMPVAAAPAVPAPDQNSPNTGLLAPENPATPTGVVPTTQPAEAAIPATQPSPAVTESTSTTPPTEEVATATQPATANGLEGFQFNAPSPYEQRVIRVPLQELLQGRLEYNVVIRPGDLIFVPDPVTGEFYMGGHVQRTGPYSLTARKITLKQAIVSAGMYDQAAIPGRTEVIRRIGDNKEVFVRVDLDRIFAGEQPDIYLKPNDVVMVGTNVYASFVAAIRNAFRSSYGFGFTYDQNFAPNQGNNNP